MKDHTLLAIQNLGVVMAFLGLVFCIMFVHFIEPLYITGIVFIVFGIIDVSIVEKILDVRKENEYV